MKLLILALALMVSSVTTPPSQNIISNKNTDDQSYHQGCSFRGGLSALGNTTTYSGNAYFDRAINEEYAYLIQKFAVRPNLAYLYDGNSPNAYATTQVTDSRFQDGTVVIGFNLIKSECAISSSGTCTAVAIILAHEFGHIVDFKYGTGLRGKYKELFADYLAGCYMYFRSVEFKYTFANEAAYSFFNKGDTNFTSPQHHGTPQQRYNCLLAGYNLAQNYHYAGRYLSLQTVMQEAKRYVLRY